MRGGTPTSGTNTHVRGEQSVSDFMMKSGPQQFLYTIKGEDVTLVEAFRYCNCWYHIKESAVRTLH